MFIMSYINDMNKRDAFYFINFVRSYFIMLKSKACNNLSMKLSLNEYISSGDNMWWHDDDCMLMVPLLYEYELLYFFKEILQDVDVDIVILNNCEVTYPDHGMVCDCLMFSYKLHNLHKIVTILKSKSFVENARHHLHYLFFSYWDEGCCKFDYSKADPTSDFVRLNVVSGNSEYGELAYVPFSDLIKWQNTLARHFEYHFTRSYGTIYWHKVELPFILICEKSLLQLRKNHKRTSFDAIVRANYYILTNYVTKYNHGLIAV